MDEEEEEDVEVEVEEAFEQHNILRNTGRGRREQEEELRGSMKRKG